jgi:hypothetical protein
MEVLLLDDARSKTPLLQSFFTSSTSSVRISIICTLHQIKPQILNIILGLIIAIFLKKNTGFGQLALLPSSEGQHDTEHLISNP